MLLGGQLGVVTRRKLVDVLISPDVADIGMLELNAIERAVEQGRAAARKALADRPGFLERFASHSG